MKALFWDGVKKKKLDEDSRIVHRMVGFSHVCYLCKEWLLFLFLIQTQTKIKQALKFHWQVAAPMSA